ncbi:MAG TPA: S8 family serine peptidase [Candidatus Polarisedimenticolaceae bacterium]|nr:S8 family serine peptidase [Candidatus Polarisedimenticolaceae bacterium]
MLRPALRLLALGLAFGAAGAADESWTGKVDPQLMRDVQQGPAEFLVVMVIQADLSPAAAIRNKLARGTWVYQTLRDTAALAQAPVLGWLRRNNVEHRSLWITDMIWVRGTAQVIEALGRRSDVRRIESNPRVRLPDPASELADGGAAGVRAPEWNLQQVNAPLAWGLGYTGRGVVVGGQDTGYEWTHPALRRQYRGWNGASADHNFNWHDAIHSGGGTCGANTLAPCDDSNHGTHTMGTMVGDDGGANQIGVAPGARWIGCRNMDQGNGTPGTYAECFQWFVAPTNLAGLNPDPAKAPDVINDSWTCPPSEGCSTITLQSVVENTRAAGIVVVASAGNSGSACSSVHDPPATYAASLSVGATDAAEQIASFSSRGPVVTDGSNRLKPDVVAPGVSVRSSIRFGGYQPFSGTSMAGPHVAGLIALLLEARPDLAGRVETIEGLVRRTAQPRTSSQSCGGVPGSSVPNNTCGFGRIDAVRLITSDTDADGANNLTDCDPLDGTAQAVPGPARAVTLDGHGSTLVTWSAPVAPGGSGVRYDLLRSTRADDFGAATCVAKDLASTSASDSALPIEAFYYLVRAKNGCGSNLGTRSDGTPRTAPSCP